MNITILMCVIVYLFIGYGVFQSLKQTILDIAFLIGDKDNAPVIEMLYNNLKSPFGMFLFIVFWGANMLIFGIWMLIFSMFRNKLVWWDTEKMVFGDNGVLVKEKSPVA